MPRRPDWKAAGISPSQPAKLERFETRKFEAWLGRVYEKHGEDNLNHFEHNLEVWRQLWRVVERSHVVLLVADARLPALHFHPTLMRYITALGKQVILCLTKADLVPPEQARKWVEYFELRLRGLPVLHVSSGAKFTHNKEIKDALGLSSAQAVLEAVANCSITKGQHEVSARPFVEDALAAIRLRAAAAVMTRGSDQEDKDGEELPYSYLTAGDEDEEEEEDEEAGNEQEIDPTTDPSTGPTDYAEAEEGPGPIDKMVLGVLGEPNTGKSSLINTLLGKKKVSTSATPGHTKHLQTHFMTDKLVLCDCPGVVFPQINVPHAVQVLFGCYPIAQVSDPFTPLRLVAENCIPPLQATLGLEQIAAKHWDDLQYAVDGGHDGEVVWSPLVLSQALAIREGYYLRGRGGRPDGFRGANCLLRDALNGREKVRLVFWPPLASQEDQEGQASKPEVEAGKQAMALTEVALQAADTEAHTSAAASPALLGTVDSEGVDGSQEGSSSRDESESPSEVGRERSGQSSLFAAFGSESDSSATDT
ncbi:unnamed protein product [Chrysoparadoxa australica]